MKKVYSVMIAAGLTFALTACEKAPEGDAQSIINQAWEKMAEKNSSYETGEMNVSGKGTFEMEENKAEVSGTGKIEFDTRDEKNVKSSFDLDLNANGELEGKKGTIALKGQARMLEKTLYLYLENLNIDAGDPQTNMMANLLGNLYKSQWISVPSGSDESTEAVSLESFKGKNMAELAKKHHFFEVKEDMGGGKYEVVINIEKLKAYLREMAKLSESDLSEEDLAAVDTIFETIEYTLQVQINEDYDLTWMKGTIIAKDPMADQAMTVSFEGTMDDNNSEGFIDLALTGTTPGKARVDFDIEHEEKSVTIEKPEGAQEFDLGSLMGGFGGGAGTGMETIPDEMMMGLPQ
jgi:hypothetical protein